MRHDSLGGQNWQAKAIVATIVVFAIVLTLHADWSRFNLDEWGDMVENYGWGVLWQWGYFKHPPFFAWAVATWFSVLPHTDLVYYAFASLNVVVALCCLWRIAARYGSADFQLFVILCAVLIPPFSFQAIKYNANSAMTPIWAAVFLFYLRGLEARRWYDALALGVLAGVAMLTKYHSAVLIATLLIHALIDREARAILFSSFGLITAIASSAVFAGHLIWLVDNDFLPITYAASQGDGLILDFLFSLGLFLVGILAYLLPALALALVFRSARDGYPPLWLVRLRSLKETVAGRALLALGILPTLLTVVLAAAAGAQLSVVWVLPLYVPLLVMVGLLLPPDLLRRHMPRGFLVFGLYCAALLISAPIYKESIRPTVQKNMMVPLERMSGELDGYWLQYGGGRTGGVMAGEDLLANAMSFYSRYAPITLEANSLEVSKGYLDRAELDRRGMMTICRQQDIECQQSVDSTMPGRTDLVKIPFVVPGFDEAQEWPFVVTIARPIP
ncbi:MAG: glycosyltransferase family 39 protein [Rhizobium sp.]|nr:glycosyltransferase family 39 protein [Rhizobium sp.]